MTANSDRVPQLLKEQPLGEGVLTVLCSRGSGSARRGTEFAPIQ